MRTNNIRIGRKLNFDAKKKKKGVSLAVAPDPPTNVQAVTGAEGISVDVSWDAPAGSVDGYSLYVYDETDYAGAYETRVTSDGGQVSDSQGLQEFVDLLVEQGIWPNVQGLFSASFGVKLDSGEVDKIYNVKKESDFIPQLAGNKGTFNASGENGKPIISGGQIYEINQDKSWLRNDPAGWAIMAADLPFGTGNADNGFYIDGGPGGAVRFRIYRDGVNDDRFDVAFNPEDDGSFLTLSNSQDDLSSTFEAFEGFANLAGQEAGSFINGAQQVYFQGPAIPDKNFPNTGPDAIRMWMNDFGLLLFVEAKLTSIQQTAVFNWLNDYYALN